MQILTILAYKTSFNTAILTTFLYNSSAEVAILFNKYILFNEWLIASQKWEENVERNREEKKRVIFGCYFSTIR